MSSGDKAIATSSATTSSVVDERERRLQKRQERERAHQHCETAMAVGSGAAGLA